MVIVVSVIVAVNVVPGGQCRVLATAATAIYYATLPLCDGACVDGVESWSVAIHWAGTTAIHLAVTTTKESSWYTVCTRNPN